LPGIITLIHNGHLAERLQHNWRRYFVVPHQFLVLKSCIKIRRVMQEEEKQWDNDKRMKGEQTEQRKTEMVEDNRSS